MRLIASFDTKEKAYALHLLLSEQNIENFVEKSDPDALASNFLVWVYNEDDIDKALEVLEHTNQNPESLKKQIEDPALDQNPKEEHHEAIKGPIKVKAASYYQRIKNHAPLTRWIIIICSLIFFWQAFQISALKSKFQKIEVSRFVAPITTVLMYDVPESLIAFKQFLIAHPDLDFSKPENFTEQEKEELSSIQELPSFKGLLVNILPGDEKNTNDEHLMFKNIKQGQFWRLFTPALLHGDLLHILFNMLWLWLLGRQVEIKIQKGRYLLLTLVLGIVTNTLQYLMTGPFFVGYSGIVCGLAGFIWVRQACAPWEGYSVQKSTLVLLLVFILGMLALQLVSIALEFFDKKFLMIQIGNTAHISGFLLGLLLAKVPFFYKVKS